MQLGLLQIGIEQFWVGIVLKTSQGVSGMDFLRQPCDQG